MRLIVGVVALCLASWATTSFSQPGQPTERPVADSGKAGTQPKAQTKQSQNRAKEKTETAGPLAPQPFVTQPGSGPDEAAREQARENIEMQRKITKYTHDVARFTKWLVVATVLGPALLLLAVLGQAWIARDTEKRQLRAYVGMSGREIFYSTGPSPRCYLILHNSGQTPAQRVECRIACRIGRYPMTDFPHEPEPFPVPGVLWPGAPVELEIFTREIAGDSRSGRDMHHTDNRAMYIYGDIRYRDAFGKARVSNFRIMFRRPPNVGGEGKPLEFAPDGNCAT